MATTNVNIKNRKATFDYEIIETFTAGIVLTGTEIKSIRLGKAGLTDTFCIVDHGEMWLKNMYISEYSYGSYNNHVTHRDRKLLLNKKEIQKIMGPNQGSRQAAMAVLVRPIAYLIAMITTWMKTEIHILTDPTL